MFQIINLEDLSSIKVNGSCEIPGGAWEMDSAGDFVFVSILSGEVYAVDTVSYTHLDVYKRQVQTVKKKLQK